MKTKIFRTSTLLAFVMALMVGTYAQAQNSLTWDVIGTKVVDRLMDRDVIELKGTKETYNALKIRVDNGSVNVHKVTVHFANGDTQDVKLPDVLTEQNDGKLIDLKGNQRVIEKVVFWYDTKATDKNNKDKAVVEVWARK